MWIIVPLILLVLIAAIAFIGKSLSEPGYSGPVSDHFDGRKFINPNNDRGNGFKEALEYFQNRKPARWTENYEDTAYDREVAHNATQHVRILFVNHSTFLIQMNGLNILTDPVWSERVSPFTFAGPKRQRPPGIAFNLLPKIHLVLLSHNHYDHLDKETVKNLLREHNPEFIVPLGVKKMLSGMNIKKVTELDWNESLMNTGISIKATPAIHFSGRGFFDRDRTLWCGYILDGFKKVYFVGDTAYDENLFRKTASENLNIDLAIIPIGAYKPQWFMSRIHTNPTEAVKIHRFLSPKQSIATHFGTFPLADEGQGEAQDDLQKALLDQGIPSAEFIAPVEGKIYEF